MRTIDKVIVHCSATREGVDIDASEIRRWHVEGNGWRDIGYHYVVKLDGSIEFGRDLNDIGSHCKGQNTGSIGVCYVGGLDSEGNHSDTRTTEQVETLYLLMAVLVRMFPGVSIYGHRDFSSKSCPCFDARGEYKELE
jgi:N-acetylmuramoyl-L-alanine amidase